MNEHWYVVGNSGEVRVLSEGREKGTYTLVHALPNPAVRLREQELVGDRAGGLDQGVSGGRPWVGMAVSPQGHVEDGFVRVIAAVLHAWALMGRYDGLTIVAPAGFMGELRGVLTADVNDRVVEAVVKDLAHLSLNSLREYLRERQGEPV